MPGNDDPDDPNKENLAPGQTPCETCRSPKDADYCRIFPYRIRLSFEDTYRWLTLALSKPGSQESQEFDALGFPRWLGQRALDKLQDPAAREAMVRQMITHVTIHEVGHAAGLDSTHDHKGVEQGTPDDVAELIRECPMYYPAEKTKRRQMILQPLFRPTADMPMRYKEFCRGAAAYRAKGYDCYPQLNVADW
jgi:hypothetical protein